MGEIIPGKFGGKTPFAKAIGKAHPERLPSQSAILLAKVFIRMWFSTETALFAMRPAIELEVPIISATPWCAGKDGLVPALFGRLRWFYLTRIKRAAIVVGGQRHTLSWYIRTFEEQHGARLVFKRLPDSDMISYWKEQNGN